MGAPRLHLDAAPRADGRADRADDRAGDPEGVRHPQALVESTTIGRGTRIWAFAHILPGARIGADCNICDGVFVENDVVVGDRVTVKCGVQLWDGVTLEDDVFVGPNATFTNDRFPRSRQYQAAVQRTVVRRGASIGANATVLSNLVIGEGAMVGAGAVVTRDVPPFAVVVGNPARLVGFVDAGEAIRRPPAQAPDAGAASVPALRTPGARLLELPARADARGTLSFAQVGAQLPFAPQRYFLITNVPAGAVRGQHAHRTVEQLIVCVRGHCTVALDTGGSREQVRLDAPTLALHVMPWTWVTIYDHSADATVMVLCSGGYDEAEYVRDYEEFRRGRPA